jgi:hypothetical protein
MAVLLTAGTGLVPVQNATTYANNPAVYTKLLGYKYQSGMPIQLELSRRVAAPTAAHNAEVWGADLPHPFGAATAVKRAKGDGSTTVFDTDIVFVTGMNLIVNNLQIQVLVGPDLAPRKQVDAGPAGTEFAVTSNGGLVRITFATAPTLGHQILIAQVTPVAIIAGNVTTNLVQGGEKGDMVGITEAAADLQQRSFDLIWLRAVCPNTAIAAGDSIDCIVRPLT